jgi:hypothetical protein
LVNTKVVPLPSVRQAGVIAVSGSWAPLFSAAIFGSFQCVIGP